MKPAGLWNVRGRGNLVPGAFPEEGKSPGNEVEVEGGWGVE